MTAYAARSSPTKIALKPGARLTCGDCNVLMATI